MTSSRSRSFCSASAPSRPLQRCTTWAGICAGCARSSSRSSRSSATPGSSLASRPARSAALTSSGDRRVVQQAHDGLAHETAAPGAAGGARARPRAAAWRAPAARSPRRAGVHSSRSRCGLSPTTSASRSSSSSRYTPSGTLQEQRPRRSRQSAPGRPRWSSSLCCDSSRTRYSDSGSAPARRASKASRPSCADERVRIVPVGQEQEADLAALARLGQRLLQRAPGRRAPGAIAVEGKHDRGHQAEDAPQVLRRGGGAERRHRVVDAGLMQAHRVHVAFDDQQARKVGARAARFVERRTARGPCGTARVSGELRYFGSPASMMRPPKAMTRPRASRIGNMMRSRKRS